jgi:hypothetical protein
MVMPHERLARMRKSFAKNKSVLTEDYTSQLSSPWSGQMGNQVNVSQPDKHGSRETGMDRAAILDVAPV